MKTWPETLEIQPLAEVRQTVVTIPGSKSITNRALILSALAEGTVTLRGALWSEDTQVMADALRKAGIKLEIEQDPQEDANRTFHLQGMGDNRLQGGTLSHPIEIYVGNSGTSARFLMAFFCAAACGWYRLQGTPRMHERPQQELFDALRRLGYTVTSEKEGYLPALIGSDDSVSSHQTCAISQQSSSQYASALMLSAEKGGWDIQLPGAESPYIRMTRQIIETFPHHGGEFQIEPDASSGSYFYAANVWHPRYPQEKPVSVAHWPVSGWQPDQHFPEYLPLPETISREKDLGDSILTAIAIAPLAQTPVTFTDLGRLRVQESERVYAMKTELTRCGVKVEEKGDTLIVYPSKPHGAEIETYNDHRIAMAFSVLGLGVPGIVIKNPACVAKTFPTFFEKLNVLRNGS
ncbi:MAG: 3-phosphoshikimate 1-carboxyvinyltransferase [Verrucomicrobia bacterium]|nr:3-phosphoshikimate 1-carboxyvinyltransferase [Verrucomicrobiota bacterium]